MKNPALWINKHLYPFRSRWATVGDHRLHYVDEGQGEIILFVHGTPEWSFGFRDLIRNLSPAYRCIAVDLLGFGLSDKPKEADFTCAGHAFRLAEFITHLKLKSLHVVANDFGGSIALHYIIHHPENVGKVVLFNTWMRSLKNDSHYSRPAKVMNSRLGKFLYLNLNMAVNVMMPAAYGDRKKLTKEVHAHYKNALPRGDRQATYALALEMSAANEWWQSLWDKMDTITSKPFLLFWGMKDKFVPPSELEWWRKKLPQSTILTYADAGHFVQEEKPSQMSDAILDFLSKK